MHDAELGTGVDALGIGTGGYIGGAGRFDLGTLRPDDCEDGHYENEDRPSA